MTKPTPKSRQPLDPDHGAPLELLQATTPPVGFRTDQVLMLTYGLDAGVAFAMLASAFGVEQRFVMKDAGRLPLGKVEQISFIERILERSLILHQHGSGFSRGSEKFREDLMRLLEDRVFSVARDRQMDGPIVGRSPHVNFHPKLVLALFRKGAESLLRIYSGSKNLTLSSALEGGSIPNCPS